MTDTLSAKIVSHAAVVVFLVLVTVQFFKSLGNQYESHFSGVTGSSWVEEGP